MIILGLGSNVGDRQAQLQHAVDALQSVLSPLKASRVVESRAVLPEGAPADWDKPYYNMVVAGESSLSASALLAELKSIEQKVGRQMRPNWAPREIDIDIIDYHGQLIEEKHLKVPHRYLLERDFVLLPLADILPEWKYPAGGICCGQKIPDLIKARGFAYGEALRDKGHIVHA